MMRGPRGRGEDAPILNEALALTPNDLFVFGDGRRDFRWFARYPGGKSRPLTLDGPSIVTFGPGSISVQPVPEMEGVEEVVESLAGDWHLVRTGKGYALVRFERAS